MAAYKKISKEGNKKKIGFKAYNVDFNIIDQLQSKVKSGLRTQFMIESKRSMHSARIKFKENKKEEENTYLNDF